MNEKSKREMLDYICGETEIDLASSPYDGMLWEIYTLRAEIDDRLRQLEKTIWILKRQDEEESN
tara:strand:+ start:1136 stop:1327 length:192 start_codon:yes stop_codon:yes gene_type:complete